MVLAPLRMLYRIRCTEQHFKHERWRPSPQGSSTEFRFTLCRPVGTGHAFYSRCLEQFTQQAFRHITHGQGAVFAIAIDQLRDHFCQTFGSRILSQAQLGGKL